MAAQQTSRRRRRRPHPTGRYGEEEEEEERKEREDEEKEEPRILLVVLSPAAAAARPPRPARASAARLMGLVTVRDEWTKLVGHRFLNSQLCLWIGLVQALVCIWGVAQHCHSVIHYHQVIGQPSWSGSTTGLGEGLPVPFVPPKGSRSIVPNAIPRLQPAIRQTPSHLFRRTERRAGDSEFPRTALNSSAVSLIQTGLLLITADCIRSKHCLLIAVLVLFLIQVVPASTPSILIDRSENIFGKTLQIL